MLRFSFAQLEAPSLMYLTLNTEDWSKYEVISITFFFEKGEKDLSQDFTSIQGKWKKKLAEMKRLETHLILNLEGATTIHELSWFLRQSSIQDT